MNEVVVQSRQVLATHARSFRWASWFLPADCRDDAAVVYAFCRFVDDTADEATDLDQARVLLEQVRAELRRDQTPRPLVEAFLEVADRTRMDVRYAEELIEGVLSDLGTVAFADDQELLRYCYRVAGTVGLMMCPILEVRDRHALAHAIDLGVAMQLTNICRDVLEDAQRQRVYLPGERLQEVDVESTALVRCDADPNRVSVVVRDLLLLAERYYESADAGMRYIPARTRFAILVASRLYRAIGLKLLAQGANPLRGRVWVPWPGKIVGVCRAMMTFFRGNVAPHPHDRQLHGPLEGLPDVNV